MQYLLCILIILLIIFCALSIENYRRAKVLLNKIEDTKIDIQICISKIEQLYRDCLVLKIKLENVTKPTVRIQS